MLELKATKSLGLDGASPAYHVVEGGAVVGRIYQAHDAWVWTLYSNCIEGQVAPGGQVSTLDEARQRFKEAWELKR